MTIMQISESAKERILEIIGENPGSMLRIKLQGGGCAGFSYQFELDNTKNIHDKIIDDIVIIDELSLMMIPNTTIEFIDELVGSYFKLSIPEAKSTCGCGTSFSL